MMKLRGFFAYVAPLTLMKPLRATTNSPLLNNILSNLDIPSAGVKAGSRSENQDALHGGYS